MNTKNILIMASGNKGKLVEFQDLLSACGYEVKPQSAYNVPEVEETGLTFVENAILKARQACEVTGLPSLADDSGIEVDALNGQPGIYSARFSEGGATSASNNRKLLQCLEGIPEAERTARYQCVLVLMQHAEDPTPLICQASWEGKILFDPIGEGGFGYDPLFFIPEKNCTAAELDKVEKNCISHRGKAMRLLLEELTSNKSSTSTYPSSS